tara:strand:- start:736 stop:1575 length:840 start_codon:yes stop_codon:yes gene_type:complete
MSLGMIGRKAGMTRIFDSSGISVPVTVIALGPNIITQIKTLEKDGYEAVQISYGSKRESKLSKPLVGHYKKNSINPGEGLIEFRINQGELDNLKVGQSLNLDIFKEGEHVDITGTTIGKGFQGGVKRHHFKTQDATHGNSLSHRALGSTGQCQDPGRVFKGKKMPGQLGNVKNTIQNLVIVRIIEEDNVILVKGSIPGHDGSKVLIKHTRKKYTLKKVLTEASHSKSESQSSTNNDSPPLDTKSASSNKDEPEKKEVSKNDSPIEESPKATTSSEADKS